MFAVMKYNGLTAWAGVAYGAGAPNQAFGLVGQQWSGNLVLHGWGGGNDLISATPGMGVGWLVHSAVLNGGSASHYKDGVQIGQFAHTYNTVLTKLVIGEETAGIGYADMEVAAVLIYNRALDVNERANVEAYLQEKYLGGGTATNTAPVVTIGSPGNGTTFSSSDTIVFTATASDLEQGNLSSLLQWSSSVNGALGTGGTISRTLSAGTHLIRATVVDSGGLGATNTVTVTVIADNPPSVTISAPVNGATVEEGTPIQFGATANDVEDGNLSSAIAWNSSRDGAIGTGGSFSRLLSVGTHTITASVIDGNSLRLRHSRWRHGSHLPAPRERDCPERGRPPRAG
jgi:hypothetical protein